VLKSAVSEIEENLQKIRKEIAFHAQKTGRNIEEIEIVAVTKGVPSEAIKEAVSAGIRVIGENRVQEAKNKKLHLPSGLKWHMIGHLQTNKVKTALGLFDLIHSVDSLKLAAAIDLEAQKLGRTVPVLLEINASGEASKFGFCPENIFSALPELSVLKNLAIAGLMTMAPFSDDEEDSRPHFRRLREIFEGIREKESGCFEMKWLSMGMSQDFGVAVEEGANLLRIGRAIFSGYNQGGEKT
jgi:PLP dependent protein